MKTNSGKQKTTPKAQRFFADKGYIPIEGVAVMTPKHPSSRYGLRLFRVDSQN